MRKTLILSACAMLFFAAAHATQPAPGTPAAQIVTLKKTNPLTTAYNVRIELVNTNGTPVTGGTGLRGYWAKNVQTGELFYPGGQEDENKFFDLPAGTYLFGAYNGYWDGAVSRTVTLSSAAEGPDGFIVVTLTYWVE